MMEGKRRRIRKIIIIIAVIIIALPILAIIFISPIAKYLVEKYDVKYTGRQITMDRAYINIFTGYVSFSNVKIYEAKSDTIFLSADAVSGYFRIGGLFSKNYIFKSLELKNPKGRITQDKKHFNIDDLVKKFSSPAGVTVVVHKEPTHFSIERLIISNGEFRYVEFHSPVNYYLKKVNIDCHGIRWNSDTIGAVYSFISGTGTGNLRGNVTINKKNLDYRLYSHIEKLNLDFVKQYLDELVNYGTFRANLDANVTATGNFKDARNLDAKGLVAINDFHFGKDTSEDFASFDKLSIDMIELSPGNHKYLFDSVGLTHPFFTYEKYDSLDNIQTMFGEKGANVKAVNADPQKFNLVLEIAKYIRKLSKDFFSSYYQVKRLAVYDGNIQYADYSTNEKFLVAANPLNFIADSIDKSKSRVDMNLDMGLKPFGKAVIKASVNPKDTSSFDLDYKFEKISAPMFNPYTITYTSFPLDRGTIELNGKWRVRSGQINSENHLVVLDPRLTKRVRKKDTRWIPAPLVMAFVRERGNVIDYEIPITGNLKNPKFHLGDVILDVLKNIFVKPPTTPYRMEVKDVENQVEKSVSIKWNTHSTNLSNQQKEFLEKISKFLSEDKNAKITVTPNEYENKEKEYILFFEAKKKYYLLAHHQSKKSFTQSDSLEVDLLSNKDAGFISYLDMSCGDTLAFAVQQKCYCIVGTEIVNRRYAELLEARKKVFLSYFKSNGTDKQVHFRENVNVTPFNGFSLFAIKYSGAVPEYLDKAYDKLAAFNEEEPRRRYEKLRKMNWNFGKPLPDNKTLRNL